MQRNPIVLIHGYSDEGASFKAWQQILVQRGYGEPARFPRPARGAELP
jgi:hypothetical protein